MNFSEYPFITILGYGREGKSTYRFLIDQGYDPDWILVRDKNYEGILEHGGALILGDGYLQGIEQDHLIFRAPGITNTILLEQGVDVDSIRHILTSQTEYFLEYYKGIVIGITGTKGKTTTSTILRHMLCDSGKSSILAGNVGKPIFDLVDFQNPPDYVVYEFSSYMLESLACVDWQIQYALVTSLYPFVHIKEHGSKESYIAAKLEIFKHSKRQLLSRQAWEIVKQYGYTLGKRCSLFADTGENKSVYFKDGKFYCGEQVLFETDVVKILGEHNLQNFCGVIALGLMLGISLESIQHSCSTFTGVEHRLEYVGYHHGLHRYNDAIATAPDATIAAIRSFPLGSIGCLLAGGTEGEYNFMDMVECIKAYKIQHVILFPVSGSRIATYLHDIGYEGTILHSQSMEDAVVLAKETSSHDTTVLLSCGSQSFSLWSGFEEKGKRFKQAILEKSKDKSV